MSLLSTLFDFVYFAVYCMACLGLLVYLFNVTGVFDLIGHGFKKPLKKMNRNEKGLALVLFVSAFFMSTIH
jgi:hypothetical protein